MVIIGISAAVAVANLFPSDEEKLQQEGERVLSLLQRARDEAVFGGRIIGVVVATDRIEFLERDITDPTRWQSSRLEHLHARPLPETLRAQLRIGSQTSVHERATTAENAQIIFLPVGVAAPFEVTLRAGAGVRRITGDAIGNMVLAREPS